MTRCGCHRDYPSPYQCPYCAPPQPVTVSFTIEDKSIWIDPDGISWYAVGSAADRIYLERTVTREVTPHALARLYRKMGDPKPKVSLE